jgi:predicted nucleic acid-binding protein
MIVADTDVLIDFLKGSGKSAERVELELKHGLYTTVITAFELWNGAAGSPRREATVETLLDSLKIIPCKVSAAKQAAQIRYSLQKLGRTIGMADSLIAGICVAERAVLLTRNTKHFSDIDGLLLGGL